MVGAHREPLNVRFAPKANEFRRRCEMPRRTMNGLMRCNKTSALPLPPARQADV